MILCNGDRPLDTRNIGVVHVRERGKEVESFQLIEGAVLIFLPKDAELWFESAKEAMH